MVIAVVAGVALYEKVLAPMLEKRDGFEEPYS